MPFRKISALGREKKISKVIKIVRMLLGSLPVGADFSVWVNQILKKYVISKKVLDRGVLVFRISATSSPDLLFG